MAGNASGIVVSHVRLFFGSLMRMATKVAVMALVSDPRWKTSSGVIGVSLPCLRTPTTRTFVLVSLSRWRAAARPGR